MDEALKKSLDSLYKEEMKLFASRRNVLRQNQIKLWGVIWGQCSPALQTEIKGNEDFSSEMVKYDMVWLLGQLKFAAAGIDRSVSPYQALVHSLTFCIHYVSKDANQLRHTVGVLNQHGILPQ